MYVLYKKTLDGAITRYERLKHGFQVSLFGCNEGWIPWILRQTITKTDNQPLRWHLSESEISQVIERDQSVPDGNALVIDLKPNQTSNLSLYEVVEAWGHSENDWTPVMLRLKGLFVDEKEGFDKARFTRTEEQIDKRPIFSMYYVRGTVKNGQICGTWNLTAPGSANSALLWAETMKYFSQQALKIINA
jgi:hypothetical protein